MPDAETAETIERLVQRCQEGDLRAFATLFEQFQDRLYDLAWAILRDEIEAEDAVQDTFLRVFERIDRYRGTSSFETWLVAVAVNVCRDWLRRRKMRRTLSLDWLRPGWLTRVLGRGEDPAEALEQREYRRSLWDTVDRLDERHRLPLILRYHYGLSCSEVGEALGLATGTIYVRLSEGRCRLRQMMLEQGQVSSAVKSRMG